VQSTNGRKTKATAHAALQSTGRQAITTGATDFACYGEFFEASFVVLVLCVTVTQPLWSWTHHGRDSGITGNAELRGRRKYPMRGPSICAAERQGNRQRGFFYLCNSHAPADSNACSVIGHSAATIFAESRTVK
jgi:hypothetical protein